MILKKIYDEKTKTQKVWYDSTMIVYTEMVEDECENKGDLYVTFKNGSTYVYRDVAFEDYVLFIAGGTDASQGKTLNKVIKSKYEFEKGEQKNVQDLINEMNRLNEEEMSQDIDITHTFRVFGEDDLTDNEIEFNYYSKINQAMYLYEDAKFVLGSNDGFDKKMQDYFMDILGVDPEIIEVFYVGDTPEYINPKIINKRCGFKDSNEQDTAMMNSSAKDIAFVRSITENSATSANILRRHLLVSL